MRVITLGTGGAMPTSVRSLPATALKREGELFLFDCGEGTQIQMTKAGLSPVKLKGVFLSHLHGDHVTGLPGLLMTLAHLSREKPLYIFGPPGIAKYVEMAKDCLRFNPGYETIVAETEGGNVYQGSGYSVVASPVDHTTFTLAYAFEEEQRPGKFLLQKALSLRVPEGPLFRKLQAGKDVTLKDGAVVRSKDVLGEPRKGRKVIYAVDTRPCEDVVRLSGGADILIHDGMFSDQLRNEANLKGHSTVVQAAEVAKKAEAEKLVLTHISPRYRGQDDSLLEEALTVFPRAVIAKDLMEFEIPVHK